MHGLQLLYSTWKKMKPAMLTAKISLETSSGRFYASLWNNELEAPEDLSVIGNQTS